MFGGEIVNSLNITMKILSKVTIMLYLLLPSQLEAASFEPLKEEKFGTLATVLYRNQNGGRQFCALESTKTETLFRINRYSDTNETFLELYNQKWKKREGSVKFNIIFSTDGQNVKADFTGKSWGDSYTRDIDDQDEYETLLEIISASQAMTIFDNNQSKIGTYDLRGGAEAVAALQRCIKGKM